MASTIQIYATQSVIFTDTTSGGLQPYSQSWTFSGGNISSATGATALVVYQNPGNYTASLSVTDSNNITNIFSSTNGIQVLAPSLNASFNPNSASSLMSSNISFSDTSTGAPQNATSWNWIVDSSSISTTSGASLSYNNWSDVPGASLGDSPGALQNVSVRLDVSNSFTSDSVINTVSFKKIGAEETDLLNRDGAGQPYVQQVAVNNTGIYADSLSYPTHSYIIEFNYNIPGSGQTIDNFHSTDEITRIILTGLSGRPEFFTGGVGVIGGYIVVEDSLYGTGDPEIVTGKYITPALPTPPRKLYFADDGTTGNITSLIDDFNYTEGLVDEILRNTYPQLNSAQSSPYAPVLPATSVSSGENPVVYSDDYFANRGFPGTVYEVTLEIYHGGTPYNVVCEIAYSGGQGNEPGGNNEFFVMQDVGSDRGVAFLLNQAIDSSSVPGGVGSVEFTADSIYNINTNSDPLNYDGLKMEIKSTDIERVEIFDNSADILATTGLTVFPFAYQYSGGSSGVKTCTGIPSLLDLSASFDYLTEGKRIIYGSSIF